MDKRYDGEDGEEKKKESKWKQQRNKIVRRDMTNNNKNDSTQKRGESSQFYFISSRGVCKLRTPNSPPFSSFNSSRSIFPCSIVVLLVLPLAALVCCHTLNYASDMRPLPFVRKSSVLMGMVHVVQGARK